MLFSFSLIVNYDAIYNQYFKKPNKNKIFFLFFYLVFIKLNAVLNYRRKKNLKKKPRCRNIRVKTFEESRKRRNV
jgi:hypothetical protein